MEKIKVDINALGSAANDIENMAGRMDERTQRLFSAISALDGMWEGEAHEVFSSLARQDAETMTEMVKKAKEIAEKFTEARKEYAACETEVSEIVNSIRI